MKPLLLLVAPATLGLASCSQQKPVQKPNVVLIVADDQGIAKTDSEEERNRRMSCNPLFSERQACPDRNPSSHQPLP